MGAIFYLVVGVVSVRSAIYGRKIHRPLYEWRHWLHVTALFGLLAVIRLTNLDHIAQDFFRALTQSTGDYEARREWQRPAAAFVILLLGVTCFRTFAIVRKQQGHPIRLIMFFSRGAALLMLLYFLLRLISLHAVDAMLYSGGMLRVNYVVDLGLATMNAFYALSYKRLVAQAAVSPHVCKK